jgi:hypothetical protein
MELLNAITPKIMKMVIITEMKYMNPDGSIEKYQENLRGK